jgi:uncharacterized protein (DUF1778 family)
MAKTTADTRFDARLTAEQKAMFEQAMVLGGFRSLTDFVIHSAREKAEDILEKHDQILKSRKDALVFFQALVNPPAPNLKLKKAALRFSERKK